MFFGEVIRWNLQDGSLYRPIRDSFLDPISASLITGHHWIGKIITGIIILSLSYWLFNYIKKDKGISEEKMLKSGYWLIISFSGYSIATLIYFIGHMYKFWFF